MASTCSCFNQFMNSVYVVNKKSTRSMITMMEMCIRDRIMCLESVFSALGGWMLLHQNLSAREVFGCVLIFAAVVLAQLPLEMLHRVKKAS